jgi:hypothetical protein
VQGLLFAALAALGIADPDEFFRLPRWVQDGHLAHQRNAICGWYQYGPPQEEQLASKAEQWLAEARARGTVE